MHGYYCMLRRRVIKPVGARVHFVFVSIIAFIFLFQHIDCFSFSPAFFLKCQIAAICTGNKRLECQTRRLRMASLGAGQSDLRRPLRNIRPALAQIPALSAKLHLQFPHGRPAGLSTPPVAPPPRRLRCRPPGASASAIFWSLFLQDLRASLEQTRIFITPSCWTTLRRSRIVR